jgi:hypothetical protein
MKKTRIRWDRVAGVALAAFMIWTCIDIATAAPKIKTTPVGDYECKGTLLKVCSGSQAVADYLGVE